MAKRDRLSGGESVGESPDAGADNVRPDSAGPGSAGPGSAGPATAPAPAPATRGARPPKADTLQTAAERVAKKKEAAAREEAERPKSPWQVQHEAELAEIDAQVEEAAAAIKDAAAKVQKECDAQVAAVRTHAELVRGARLALDRVEAEHKRLIKLRASVAQRKE